MTRPWLRSTATLTVLFAAASGAADERTLLSNGQPLNPDDWGLLPSANTVTGIMAPDGSFWSELQAVSSSEGNAAAGFCGQSLGPGGYRFADDFVIPPGDGWTINRVRFFVYSPGFAQADSPVSGITVRVWSGVPDAPGSVLVFGDTTVNRYSSAAPTNLYRVFSTVASPPTPPDTTRRIWTVDASLSGMHLPPGAYWLDWQFTSSSPSLDIYTPAVTIAGARLRTGANAKVMPPVAPPAILGPWVQLTDPGKPVSAPDMPQELPFLIIGTDVPAPCLADLTGVGGPPEPPDHQITVDDMIAFVNAFSAGEIFADLTAVGGPPQDPDGQVTVDDLIAFVNSFSDGCTF